MKQANLYRLFFGCLLVAVLGLFGPAGCEPDDNVLDHPPASFGLGGDVYPSRTDACVGGRDDDMDEAADRYGVPEHCTIEAPVKTTNLGSQAVIYAVGWYDYPTADTYTIQVTTPGGSGVAQITASSVLGNAPPTPLTVTIGQPLFIGSRGLIVIFTDSAGAFNLVLNETWTIRAKDITNCALPPDPGCFLPGSRTEVEQCANGLDDDYDGNVDSADIQCLWNCTGLPPGTDWFTERFQFTPQCTDGIDNDNDGLIDAADPDCTGSDCVPFE